MAKTKASLQHKDNHFFFFCLTNFDQEQGCGSIQKTLSERLKGSGTTVMTGMQSQDPTLGFQVLLKLPLLLQAC